LYGGAIHLAGAVKAKSQQRNTTSDWMEIERKRGISISTSVLRFEYDGIQVNLLDTPGHKDFSEDTYRTLVAVDAAVMLIDAAKGVEPQTRKLFEVCRMRGLPIFTFFNKLDRPSRDPLDLIDELEKVLGIRSTPVTWPIGMGQSFKGVYDRRAGEILLFQREEEANEKGRLQPVKVSGLDDPKFLASLSGDRAENEALVEELRGHLELLEAAGDPFDTERVLAGQLTPVFCGSAMNNFGVQRFLENFLQMAPPPSSREGSEGEVLPTDPRFSGLFFKIQANMDPQHRDRVAFLRVCSGKFTRGMEAKHGRLDKNFRLSKSIHFFGQERMTLEEAWPGDIVGLLDTGGDFRIGDTLAEGRRMEFEGVPRFAPENFATVGVSDPLKRKQLQKGLEQLTEEGVVQLFRHPSRAEAFPFLGAVGALQFEVFEARLKSEYRVDVKLERLPFVRACWPQGEGVDFEEFNRYSDCAYVVDRDNQPVVLFKSDWSVNWAKDKFKGLVFLDQAPLRRA
ncbi:peptide chain release factor 3, partial [bacterium]|nr:peptide chain release factor 3 [bacterium]